MIEGNTIIPLACIATDVCYLTEQSSLPKSSNGYDSVSKLTVIVEVIAELIFADHPVPVPNDSLGDFTIAVDVVLSAYDDAFISVFCARLPHARSGTNVQPKGCALRGGRFGRWQGRA